MADQTNSSPMSTGLSGPLPYIAPTRPQPTFSQPFLGGYLSVIPGTVGPGANVAIAHAMRSIPKSVTVYDSSVSAQPGIRVISRDFMTVTVALSTTIPAGQNLLLLLQ